MSSIGDKLPETIGQGIGWSAQKTSTSFEQCLVVAGSDLMVKFVPYWKQTVVALSFVVEHQMDRWYMALCNVWAAARHKKRRIENNQHVWRGLMKNLLTPGDKELNFSGVQIQPQEFRNVLQDLPEQSEITHVDLSSCGLNMEWFSLVDMTPDQAPPSIVSWNMSRNLLTLSNTGDLLSKLAQFIVASGAEDFDFSSCAMGDQYEFGSLVADMILSRDLSLRYLTLSDNLLGPKFVKGFVDTAQTQAEIAAPEREGTVTLNLHRNLFDNEDALTLTQTVAFLMPHVTYLGILECPKIAYSFYPTLFHQFHTILLVEDLTTEPPQVLLEKINELIKPDPLRLVWQDAERGTLCQASGIHLHAQSATKLLQHAATSESCRRLRLDFATGDLFVGPPAIPGQLDYLSLQYSEWLSTATLESAQETYPKETTLDPRLRGLFECAKSLNLHELNLAHTPLVSSLSSELVGRFLADLIRQCPINVIDLSGCGIDSETIVAFLYRIQEREILEAQVETEPPYLWRTGRKLFLAGQFNERNGRVDAMWTLTHLRLDFNPIETKAAVALVELLLAKCPRLQCVSFVGTKVANFEIANIDGETKNRVGRLLRLGAIADSRYLSLELALAHSGQDDRVITQEDIKHARPMLQERWLSGAIESRNKRRLNRYKSRANRLEQFLKGRSNTCGSRIPTLPEQIGGSVSGRLNRRLERHKNSKLPESLVPPFRAPRTMLDNLGHVDAPMKDEFEAYVQTDKVLRVLDFSGCAFEIDDFEHVLSGLKKLALGRKGTEVALECLYMVNCGIDELHLTDLAHLLNFYPLTVAHLDVSVNRLACPEPDHFAALKQILSRLQSKMIILDANWFMDSEAFAVTIAQLILSGGPEHLSIQLNGLGDQFAASLCSAFEIYQAGLVPSIALVMSQLGIRRKTEDEAASKRLKARMLRMESVVKETQDLPVDVEAATSAFEPIFTTVTPLGMEFLTPREDLASADYLPSADMAYLASADDHLASADDDSPLMMTAREDGGRSIENYYVMTKRPDTPKRQLNRMSTSVLDKRHKMLRDADEVKTVPDTLLDENQCPKMISRLKVFDIRHNQISTEAMAKLIRFFSKGLCPGLQEMRIANNKGGIRRQVIEHEDLEAFFGRGAIPSFVVFNDEPFLGPVPIPSKEILERTRPNINGEQSVHLGASTNAQPLTSALTLKPSHTMRRRMSQVAS